MTPQPASANGTARSLNDKLGVNCSALKTCEEKSLDARRLHPSQSNQVHYHGQACLRGLRENRRYLGPPAAMPGMRARRLLRFLEDQACHQTFSSQQAS